MEEKGMRKVKQSDKVLLAAAGGFMITGVMLWAVTSASKEIIEAFVVFCLTITGNLGIFVAGNAAVHKSKQKNG